MDGALFLLEHLTTSGIADDLACIPTHLAGVRARTHEISMAAAMTENKSVFSSCPESRSAPGPVEVIGTGAAV